MSIPRLVRLIGSDPGFYILALHSYMEAALREICPGFLSEGTFWDNMSLYYEHIKSRADRFLPELKILDRIKQEHMLTNQVRHRFASATAEEARGATFRFLSFCRLAGIEDPSLNKLEEHLELWNRRESRAEDLAELSRLGFEAMMASRKNRELLSEMERLRAVRDEAQALGTELRRVTAELSRLEASGQSKEEKSDRLRQERAELKTCLREREKELESLKEAAAYADNLRRLIACSRTRTDYERSLLRLTAEQADVLKRIDPSRDFLIKGSAGTGKSMVLLKVMESIAARRGEPGIPAGPIVLLTYTRTLVKYDRYLLSVLGLGSDENRAVTADAFLNELYGRVFPGGVVDYNLPPGGEENGKVGRLLSRKRLFEAAETGRLDKCAGVILVDEAQDLMPEEISVLKGCCTGGLILAGDMGQGIFRSRNPWNGRGLTLQGRTVTLKTNFRSTAPIHTLASRFRGCDEPEDPALTFREGPAPELFAAEKTEELYTLLQRRVRFLTEQGGFSPENLFVLIPSYQFENKVKAALEEAGFVTALLKEKDFDFEVTPGIRISPLPSSKGLDMPAVLLFLPRFFATGEEGEPESSETIRRNLLYVCMTRAMDTLDLFLKREPGDPLLDELKNLLS